MNYSDFTVEDFAADPFFQQWVLAPDEMTDAFWTDWQAVHPQKQTEVDQAIRLIRSIRFETPAASEQDFKQVWQDIIAHRTAGNYQLKSSPTYRWLVAASLLLVGLGFSWWLVSNPSEVIYQTEYEEKQKITLPDGSTVLLGANSRLHHRRNWAADKPRFVTLEGEAYFTVVHQEDDQKFIVQSGEVAIEVLGTRFNVNNRRSKHQILLEEGSIRLDVSQLAAAVPHPSSPIVMEPGEVVKISSEGIAQEAVNTAPYVSWTRDTLIFRQASLREVMRSIEDHYGYTVTAPGVAVEDRHLTAELRTTDLDMILRYLSEIFDLTVHRTQNEIILRPRTTNSSPGRS